jgi:hypothetical protein
MNHFEEVPKLKDVCVAQAFRGCVKTRTRPLVYTLVRFVLVRVISWIILFGRVKRTIHEITRTNTNKNTKENRVLTQPLYAWEGKKGLVLKAPLMGLSRCRLFLTRA